MELQAAELGDEHFQQAEAASLGQRPATAQVKRSTSPSGRRPGPRKARHMTGDVVAVDWSLREAAQERAEVGLDGRDVDDQAGPRMR